MRTTNSLLTLVIVGLVLFSAAFACKTSSTTTTNSTAPPTPAGTKATATPENKKPATIAGKYDATGTNPGGKGEYKATLTVTPRDDVYQFTWVSGKNTYDGVGVMTDGEVAVSFTVGDTGKGCGVVLYKKNADGSMDGKIGYWGNNSMETERATRADNSPELDGVYAITGKNPEGNAYTGKLTVIQSGEGYTFDWEAGNNFSGFGIKAGDYIAVGFGGKQCSFVGYDVQSDGTLEGKWGSFGSTALGTETAKPKK